MVMARRRQALLAALAALAPAAAVRAQASQAAATAQTAGTPRRTVRLVLPFPAGATSDVLARVVVPAAAALLGEDWTIDNRPGAGGTLGTAEAARAAPDGQTMLWGTVSNMTIAPALYPDPGYDPLAFVPVARLFGMPHVLTAHTGLGVRSLAELLELARRRPGDIAYASSGNGTISHLIGELFQRRAGVQLLHVPYRSGPQGLADHLSGRVALRFDTLLDALPALQRGSVLALAVTTAARVPLLPAVPTLQEAAASEFAGLAVSGWFGVYAPPGTAQDRVTPVGAAFLRALEMAEVQQALAPHGVQLQPGDGRALAEQTRSEAERWGALVRAGQVRPG
jgi:tripartite-type tricarboxylate transporter receptor subunit TctC